MNIVLPNNHHSEASHFWNHPEKWRRDIDGYVFLPRAYMSIGPHVCQGWQPHDPVLTYALTVPIEIGSRSDSRNRHEEVALYICDAIVEGRLKYALLPKAGGAWDKQIENKDWHNGPKAEHWNITSPLARFAYCEMKMFDWVSENPKGDRLVYLEESGLETLIASLVPAKKSTVAKQNEFKDWFRDEIEKSPTRRSISKKGILIKAVEDFGITRAYADGLRKEVIREFPVDVQNIWTAPGAPKAKDEPSGSTNK